MRIRAVMAAATITALGMSIAGCAPTSAPPPTGLSIVASTNVWGNIAQSVAGDNVTVTSLITSSAQDPHSYEASARDRLAISRADLVIENGGGYDPFIDALVNASGTANSVVVLDASEASGLAPTDAVEEGHDDHGHIAGFNEHVWYSFGAVDAVAGEIADELSTLDPANAAEYDANHEALSAELEILSSRAAAIGTIVGGQQIAITEPVPLYLLEAVSLINATPAEFSEAFEEGIDIPPTALRDTLALFTSGDVVLLAYNDQTTSGQGELVLDAAKKAGVAVVPFAETLPEGQDYVSWMSANLEALATVLIS
jgi:zinc/manganese transport system substrate-binding protein